MTGALRTTERPSVFPEVSHPGSHKPVRGVRGVSKPIDHALIAAASLRAVTLLLAAIATQCAQCTRTPSFPSQRYARA